VKVGDAEATGGILAGAGFDAIRFQDVREPVATDTTSTPHSRWRFRVAEATRSA